MQIRVDLDSGAWCRDGAFVEDAFPDKFDVPNTSSDAQIGVWINSCKLFARLCISCWMEESR